MATCVAGAAAVYHVSSFRLLEEKHLLSLPTVPPHSSPPPPPAPVVIAPSPHRWTLWDLVRPDWLHWLAAIAGALGDAIVSLLIPSRIGGIVTGLASSDGVAGADFAALGGLLVLKAALYFVTTLEVRAACESFAARLKERLFGALLQRDMSSFDAESVHQHLSLISSDVRELKLTLGKVLQDGLSASATVVGGVAMLWMQSPVLTAMLCSTVPVVFGVGTLLASKLKKELSKVRDMDALTQAHAGEVLSHIRTVRAFGTEETEEQRYADSVREVKKEYGRVNLMLACFGAVVAVTFSGLTAATLLAGTQLDQSVNLPSYLMIAGRTQASFSVLTQLFSEVQRVGASSERVLEYLNHRPKIPLRGGLSLANPRGRITFDDVSFSYPSRPEQPVFRNMSLNIEPGECVAFVGKSGAGKTSLTMLVLRFYDVALGKVTIDGIDVRLLDPTQLRSVVGVVEQRPLLFQASVAENIRYGSPEATDGDVREAARLANCDEFVEKMPEGYETVLGPDGSQLSGGQLQRLAIARALIRNKRSKILLLDEATSALDGESEALVQDAIDKVRKGKSVMLIAHRLSTVKRADRIVVMEKGQIVEMGSYEQLMAAKGEFYKMAQKQQLK